MTATAYNAAVAYDAPIAYIGDAYQVIAVNHVSTPGASFAGAMTGRYTHVAAGIPGDLTSGGALQAVSATHAATPSTSLTAAGAFAYAANESATPGSSLNAAMAAGADYDESGTPGMTFEAISINATPESRKFYVGGFNNRCAFLQDPDARLDYCIDWNQWLGADVIATTAWLVPAALTLYVSAQSPTTTTAWFTGGIEGKEYRITNRIQTDVGRINDQTITLKIRSR